MIVMLKTINCIECLVNSWWHNYFFLQYEFPATVGVSEVETDAMETDDTAQKQMDKKYYIDTVNLKVARKGMEMTNFLHDGMSKNFLSHLSRWKVLFTKAVFQ